MATGRSFPLFAPMLATLGPLPSGPGWSSEFKWDGVRAVTYVDADRVRVMSRNDLDVTSQYPELGALPRMLAGRRAVLDGEIIALDATGVPRFELLQNRIHVRSPSPALLSGTPLVYHVFDVLALDAAQTIGLPYTQRRDRLEELGLDGPNVRTPPAFADAEPADVYSTAVGAGLEGVVCKRLGSTYQPGRRSPDWVKVPVQLTQEVVIVGWHPGKGRRAGMIGALLLGAYDASGTLVYLGKVGTGFTDASLRSLADQLAPLRRDAPAVTGVPREDARGAHWVEPGIVGEVALRNRTAEGRLRHPSWRGLRPERDPGTIRVDRAR